MTSPGDSPAESGLPLGDDLPPQRDPSRLRRLAFGLGFALPRENVAWVGANLTGPGWRRRQVVRSVAGIVVLAVVLALLPGSPTTRTGLPLVLLLCGLLVALATSTYTRNRRMVQHGLRAAERAPADEDPQEPGAEDVMRAQALRNVAEQRRRDADPPEGER
jgi:hypothetical protein